MRIHLVGLPHTDTIANVYDQCAFTGKIRRLAGMLTAQGHDVYLYAGERNDAPCAEHIVCVTSTDRYRWFGDETYTDRVFDRWSHDDPCWTESSDVMIRHIQARIQPGDLIALPIGSVQAPIPAAFPDHTSFESGIGYEGSWLPYRVFESYAWMHHTYGRQNIHDGRYYDTVIPNPVDPSDFHFRPDDDGYVLFLGRHTERKGLAVVEEVAKHYPVVSAGQGGPIPGVAYLGVVRGEERAALLAGARALLCPTGYIEPWGGVAIEAQVSGTPVLCTDWGGFTENVEPGVAGFRCRSLGDFLWGVEACDDIDRDAMRRRALDLYSLDAVAPQYDRYLRQLDTLRGVGWYDTSRRGTEVQHGSKVG
jgi:glycosyltransferase involved in cell wall biosynthesis